MNKFVAKTILALAAGVVIPGGAVMAQNTQAVQPSASVIAAMQALKNVKAGEVAEAVKGLASKYDAVSLATAAGALGLPLNEVLAGFKAANSGYGASPVNVGSVALTAAYETGVNNSASFSLASAAGNGANNNNNNINNQLATNQNSGFSGSNNSSFSGGGSGGSTTKASGS